VCVCVCVCVVCVHRDACMDKLFQRVRSCRTVVQRVIERINQIDVWDCADEMREQKQLA
jgi:hypothetical protein